MAYSRAPSLGLVLFLLKTSTADFFRFHQSHRQSLGKLQSLDQLPPEELKEVMMDQRTNSLSHVDSTAINIEETGIHKEKTLLYSKHCTQPCLVYSFNQKHLLCSCAKAWSQAQEGWRKSRQCRGACWPRDDWSSLSTTEPSCWPCAPVSFCHLQP